mgnify:CR=1 FL=1
MNVKFDLAVPIKVEIDYGARKVSAVSAFVSSSTGLTYGSTTTHNWSQKTLDLVTALRDSMAKDVTEFVREGGSSSSGVVEGDPSGAPVFAGLDKHIR